MLAAVLTVGSLFALPNLYGNDPAVLISPRQGEPDQALVDKALATARAVVQGEVSAELLEERIELRFASVGDQTVARDAIDDALGRDYITALNLISAAPEWLRGIAQPLYLGLDLRGGALVLGSLLAHDRVDPSFAAIAVAGGDLQIAVLTRQ